MVKVDKEKCIGCGTCASICPKVFEMSDDKAVVKKGQGKSKIPCIKDAVDSCPEGAINE
jgi:ferredoxin